MTIGEALLGVLVLGAFVAGALLAFKRGSLLEWLAAMALIVLFAAVNAAGRANR